MIFWPELTLPPINLWNYPEWRVLQVTKVMSVTEWDALKTHIDDQFIDAHNMLDNKESFAVLVAKECESIKNMLIDKNRKYGNSALEPKRIFSKADSIEQLNVRIDDKLSRIASAQTDDTEDAELDLIGYLILKRIAHHDLSK